MEQDVTVLVCCHKKDYSYDGAGYLPVQVGKAISSVDLGFQGDDEGDNISTKNRHFCELTAHYWYWKNRTPSKYVGLNHYRRYFDFSGWNRWGNSLRVVSDSWIKAHPPVLPDMDKVFSKYDIVLAKRRSHPVNLWYDYAMSHIVNDEIILRQVIEELSPEYLDAFEKVMRLNNKLSHYNMFITKAEYFDDYSKWLFSILMEVEKRVSISGYSDQARLFGYLSERMLNIYAYHKKLRIKYVPVFMVYEGPDMFSPSEERWSTIRDNFTSWFYIFPRRLRKKIKQ